MVKICLDPGHGGLDAGAVGPSGLKEKDVNLAVAKRLAQYLSPVCEIKLTRSEDRRLRTDESTDLAARVATAENWRADYFVSIHCNSGKISARGVETYAYQPGGKGEQLAKAIQAELVKETGLVDRGVKFAKYYVLHNTSMPAVLVELAFISNRAEEELLKSPIFQDKCAYAVAQGIAKAVGLNLKKQYDNSLKIKVGGKEISGLIINDRSYAPVRELAEALGKKVDWDANTRTVTIS